MGLFKKINLSNLFILAILITILVYFISLKEKEKKLRIGLQEKLDNVLKEMIVKEEELNKLNMEKLALEETVSNLKAKIESLTLELEKEKATSLEISGKLKEKEEEVEKLKIELEKLKAERRDLENKISEAEGRIKSLEMSLVQLQTIKDDLERRLENIMSKRLEVELEKVVVRKPPSEIVGRILAVNHPYEFVVINLGKEEGIEVGTILGVYRGKDMIAKVKVEKIYEKMSVADILSETVKGIIRDEDLVKPISLEE